MKSTSFSKSIISGFLIVFCCSNLTISKAYSQTREQLSTKFISKADSLSRAGKVDNAELAYKQALIFNKKSVEALVALGKIAHLKHDSENEQRWFKRALEIQPHNREILAYLDNPKLRAEVQAADSLLSLTQLKAAERIYKGVLKKNSDYVPAIMGMGKVAFEKKKWKNAKNWFSKVLKHDPQNETARQYLLKNPNAKSAELITRADKFRQDENYKKAIKMYKNALKLYPNAQRAFSGLAKIAFEEKNYGDVKKWYGKIVKIEPDDLESIYSLGIAYRETGKTKNLLIKKIQFGKSKKYLNMVIEKDSTYRDIFYQRALLERWKQNWIKAVEYGKKQIMLKPGDYKSYVGLFELYQLFLRHKSKNQISAYLNKHPDDWTNLIFADYYRQKKNTSKANYYYKKLLVDSKSVNKTVISLSLIRFYVQQQNLAAASNLFNEALNRIDSDLDAQFMYEDDKYIFTDVELQIFDNLIDISLKKQFFHKFWTERNPTPSSPRNMRALEHYRRLVFAENNFWFDGVKFWGNSPDKMGYLKFPRAYSLNDKFNDKGLIYIRQGPPNDYAVTPSASESNESWHYYQRGDRPELIFHFLVDEKMGTGNNWRLAPYITNSRMLEDRTGWDPKLDRLRMASDPLETNSVLAQIADESKEVVFTAMSTDYHTWDKNVKELPMPFFTANFRGKDQKTQFEVYFGLPIAQLQNNEGQQIFEYSSGVFDENWKELGIDSDNVDLNQSQVSEASNIFIHKSEFELNAGSYHLSLYAKVKNIPKIGGWKVDADVQQFPDNSLSLSDILLAYDIHPSTAESSIFDRNDDLTVVPNPTKIYDLTKPVFLYFEIYCLTMIDGKTNYEVENTLTLLKKKKKGLLKIFGFGGKKKSISIRNKREGANNSSDEFSSFDVSKLDEGDYRMTVLVTDLNSQKKVEKSIDLKLMRN